MVVQATLHNCAHSIQTHLDFESIHSLLSEQEIVPLASDKSLMRIMPADTTQRQVNNLVIWLRRATGEQFLGFIAALRESDGGRPHDDLADTLEKEYKKLKDDPGTSDMTVIAVCVFVTASIYFQYFTVLLQPRPRPT